MRSLLLTAVLALATAASAQPAPYESRMLPPGGFDLRFGADADALLSHVGATLGVDYGLAVLGPGTLSLGVEGVAGTCLFGCHRRGVESSRTYLSPLGRLAFHFPITGHTQNVSESGVYALLVGGAAFASQRADFGGGTVVEGNGTVPVVGVGFGSTYFPGNGDAMFAGGEVRLVYAGQVPAAGSGAFEVPAWRLTGIRVVFTMGVRL